MRTDVTPIADCIEHPICEAWFGCDKPADYLTIVETRTYYLCLEHMWHMTANRARIA